MTYIEQAIRKAIEGGYEMKLSFALPIITDERKLTEESWAWIFSVIKVNKLVGSIFLDPNFWIALGKSLGWKDFDGRCAD